MKTKFLLSLLAFAIFISLNAQNKSDINIDKKYNINTSGTLHLKSDDADVKINGTDRNDVHVKIYRKVEEKGIVIGESEFRVDINERNGDLYIEDFEQSSNLTIVGYREEDYRITIEMPQSMSLKIRGDDDDYRIENINGEIRMDIDDADANLRNCKGNYFDFDIDDGDVTMDIASGYLKLNIDDGDFEVENASFTEIEANIDDGDALIKTSLSNNSNYNLIVDDGTIDLGILSGGGKFTINHDDSSISSSSEFERTMKDDNRTVFNLNDGSAIVKLRSDDGKIRLRTL